MCGLRESAMPRKGGQSTASGVAFQALAVARRIIDVYEANADWVRAEVPPKAELGAEGLLPVAVDDYVFSRAGHRVYCHAKSNAPGGGSWTVRKLAEEEVIQDFSTQIDADPTAECYLVTPSPCPLLGDLAERVRHSASEEEFTANLGQTQILLLDELCCELGVGRSAAFIFLRRCRLETRSAEQTQQELDALSTALFADPRTAVDRLHCLAMHAMETGERLDREAVVTLFTERTVFPKPKASEAELLAAFRSASERLRSVGKDIANVHVLQPAVWQLSDWVRNSDSQRLALAVLLDQAGSGKTVAMSVLQNRLESVGYTVLGIKVDGLSFANLDELASAIGCPAPIASAVQSLRSSGRQVAVLVDQVDALSSAMSREPAAITTVLDLVARLVGIEGVPVVLACRSFDWRYDARLRTLRGRHPTEFSLPEFTHEQMNLVLGCAGIRLDSLHPLTAKVVRCPLRLKILMEVVQAQRGTDPAWSPSAAAVYTPQALYQEFWTLKMAKAEADGIGAAPSEALAAEIATKMHDSQQLAVPEAGVASHHRHVTWLVSEGILVRHGGNLSFFHQTFFDFIFARDFVGSEQSLVEHLAKTDQGLFFRPMVRQILEYLRDVQPQRYLADLKGVLQDQGIRKHLRWLTISWLGQHPDPKPEELDLLEPFLADGDLRRRTLGHLRQNPGWFDLLTPDRFRRWLESLPDAEIDNVVWFLRFLLPDRQAEIITLLRPHAGRSERWSNRIAFALAYVKQGWQDCSADLLTAILTSPETDIGQNHNSVPHWGTALEALAGGLPTKGCEAVTAILDRCLPTKRAPSHEANEGEQDGTTMADDWEISLPEAHGFQEALAVLAEKTPAEFLRAVLPWTLAAMALTSYAYNEQSFADNWRFWRWREPYRNGPTEQLLKCIATAARNLARTDPAAFRGWGAAMLVGDFAAMQIILGEVYTSRPAEFAHDVAEFLSSDPRRLRLYAVGEGGWHSTDLIRAACPHWSSEDFARVEKAILDLKPLRTESLDDVRWHGQAQLCLLGAFDPKRLSQACRNLLGQLERKFPGMKAERPIFDSGQMRAVGPPIAPDAIRKMTDAGWLGAMKKHVAGRDSSSKPIELSGGRLELSRALQMQAKEQPERFWRLAMEHMDDTYHPDYVAAIITGIAEADADLQLLEQLVRKFAPILERGGIRHIASAIGRYAEKTVPQYLVDLLKNWALHAENPKPETATGLRKKSNKDDLDLFNRGINTDRGDALWTLAMVLLKAKPPRAIEFLDIAEQVTADPSAAVRAVCIEFLQYAMAANPPRACNLFRCLVGSDSVLLRESGAYDFIYHSLHRHAEEVLWAIEAMLADQESDKAREAGAKLACLAAFGCPAAEHLRDSCLAGEVPLRKGAAAVYATNVAEATVGPECRERFRKLMNDDDHEVRDAAADFWRHLRAADIRDLAKFLREWASTKSIDEGADDAARALEEHGAVDPQLTLDIAWRLVEVLGAEITNFQTRHGMISHALTPAVLNVYHRAQDSAVRSRAIDLFERLEELGCSEVRTALEAVDRL
jgi:hypothetical protein